jgi:hypothetical protein
MRTRLKLNPGQRGTRKLVAEHGDRLVCVRYRYDETRRKRYKTVELIVDEVEWTPGGPVDPQAVVRIRVEGYERELRARVKQAGARWKPQEKVWEISHAAAKTLGIQDRIVG